MSSHPFVRDLTRATSVTTVCSTLLVMFVILLRNNKYISNSK